MWAIILMQIIGPMLEGLGRMLSAFLGAFLSVLNGVAGLFYFAGSIPFAIGAMIMKLVDLFLGLLP
jgi:hypothetical protein